MAVDQNRGSRIASNRSDGDLRPSPTGFVRNACPPHLWGGGAKRRRGWSAIHRLVATIADELDSEECRAPIHPGFNPGRADSIGGSELAESLHATQTRAQLQQAPDLGDAGEGKAVLSCQLDRPPDARRK